MRTPLCSERNPALIGRGAVAPFWRTSAVPMASAQFLWALKIPAGVSLA
jgi:hypothetical protein